MSGLPLFGVCTRLGMSPLYARRRAAAWFRRAASATFTGSENGGRHRVSYVCEYYEVLHVWHYTHPGAQHSQGAVKFDRLHQPRLRERFPRNGLHPEVCYSALLSVTVIRLARSWVMGTLVRKLCVFFYEPQYRGHYKWRMQIKAISQCH